MIHTIANKLLQISINQKGAELCSIKSTVSHKEFMWEGNPEIWGSSSPVLFPIVGGLKNNCYSYKGKDYSLPRHGFIRNNSNIRLVENNSNSLTFSLMFNTDTLLVYPFKFEFRIKYVLTNNRINIEHEVISLDDKTIYFSLGGHPAFKCPIYENEDYEDYYLQFEDVETLRTWDLDKNGQIEKIGEVILNNCRDLPLHKKLFDNDALIFKHPKSNSICLKNNKNKQVIKVSYPSFSFVGIWAKPNAPFVCIEPWMGIADSCDSDQNIETKEGILTLEPKNIYKAAYSIEISE